MNNYDSLTGLLCRSAFEIDKLTPNFDNHLVAALIIDFDRFSEINRVYGRPIGDFVLAVQARRLQKKTVNYRHLSYRYEGDRFLELIFSDAPLCRERLFDVVDGLQKTLSQAIKYDQDVVETTCCIGAALKSKDMGVAQLATEAMLATEDAKQRGRNNIQLYVQQEDEGVC